MFHVDPADPTPAEAQLVRSVRAAIDAGVLAPGEQLPTVRQLAVQLRLNANAVARVYAELAHAGVVETRPGVGTFARAPGTDAGEERLARLAALEDALLEDAAGLGFSLDDVIIHLDSRRE